MQTLYYKLLSLIVLSALIIISTNVIFQSLIVGLIIGTIAPEREQ